MDVNTVTNSLLSDSPTTGPPEASQELDEQDFLNLLLTQLQFQDPLDPMEGVEMVNQIATLNQVEQLEVANGNLEQLILGMASLNNASAMQLVDKDVMVIGDTFTAQAGSASFGYVLGQDVDDVEVSILDSAGNVVQTWGDGDTSAGFHELTFRQAEVGETYTVVVNATSDGVAVDAQAAVVGHVDGLDFSEGLVQLVVGDDLVGLDEVLQVLPTGFGTETGDFLALAQELIAATEAAGIEREEETP